MFKKAFPLLLSTILIACSTEEPPNNSSEVATVKAAIEVSAITLQAQSFIPEITVVGSIQAAEEIVLSAEVVAPVKKIYIREGQKIKRGDLLLALDSEKLQLGLTRAKQNLEQTRSHFQESAGNLKRRKELAEQKTLSEELLDAARHESQRAKASFTEAEAAADIAQRNLTDSQVVSPVNGVIDKLLVEVGEAVQEGQQLLLIQATDQLEAKTFVSERDIHLIREGNRADIMLANWPETVFSASVLTVGIAGDARTGNFPITLLISPADDPSATPLRPGMTATIKIKGSVSQSSLLIPESALVDYQRDRVVFVIEDQKASLRRPLLQVGLGDQVKVQSGLLLGDRVIVQSNRPLKDGIIVTEQ